MPVQAPPRPPDREELDDALIEEARRRARRRRLGYVAVVIGLVALAGGLYAVFGGGGGAGPTVQGPGTSGGGAGSGAARSSSASRNDLYKHRCPGRGLDALPLTPRAEAAARSITARRVGSSSQIEVTIRPGTTSSVAYLCGPKVAHRTLWVETYDHRFDHGPNRSASLAQHRFAVSRFGDGYHLWYLEH